MSAATLVAELGGITRFTDPRQIIAYLGLVPSEHSSGRTRRQGRITKAGKGAARRLLIEAAWSHRFPARISCKRLCGRYRKLVRTGKLPTVITVVIARELSTFIWAIAKQAQAAAPIRWHGGCVRCHMVA